MIEQVCFIWICAVFCLLALSAVVGVLCKATQLVYKALRHNKKEENEDA